MKPKAVVCDEAGSRDIFVFEKVLKKMQEAYCSYSSSGAAVVEALIKEMTKLFQERFWVAWSDHQPICVQLRTTAEPGDCGL